MNEENSERDREFLLTWERKMGKMTHGGLPKLAVETVQFYYCQTGIGTATREERYYEL